MRWIISILWFSRVFGLLLLCLSFSPHRAKADYPEGVKFDYKWYVCTTGRTATNVPWVEPSCQEIPIDYDTLDGAAFSWSAAVGPGTFNSWERRYIVVPEGVDSFRLSCVVSGAVIDDGFGAGTYNMVSGQNGVHLTKSGASQGAGFSGLNFYWYTHTVGLGHDMGSNENDPFYSWVTDQGSTLSGRPLGSYVETTVSTTGNQVTATVEGDCYVDTWTGGYEVPTPTPTIVDPTATPLPEATPTLGVFPTPVGFPTPLPTPVPVPTWDVDIGYTPTVSETTCYVFIPAVPLTTTQWLDLFNIPVPTYDDVGVCVEPFDMAMIVGPWNVGRLAWLLISVALVVGVWRMFDS